MFRFTIRELALVTVTALVTAAVMYCIWQADRAVLALRLSQMQVRAMKAESEVAKRMPPVITVEDSVVCTVRDTGGRFTLKADQSAKLEAFLSSGVSVEHLPADRRPIHPPSSVEYNFAVSKPSGEIVSVQAIYPSLYRANGELFLSTKATYSQLKAVLNNEPTDIRQ